MIRCFRRPDLAWDSFHRQAVAGGDSRIHFGFCLQTSSSCLSWSRFADSFCRQAVAAAVAAAAAVNINKDAAVARVLAADTAAAAGGKGGTGGRFAA